MIGIHAGYMKIILGTIIGIHGGYIGIIIGVHSYALP